MKANEAGERSPAMSAGTALASPRDRALSLLALLVLLLATRPFPGIVHDASLYAVQALRALGGNSLGEDLFFRYGNQGGFSIFGAIWTPAVAALGLAQASVVFWALGLTIWLAGLVTLTRSVFESPRIAYAAAGFVLILNPGYGNAVLGYGENFVTSRLFAEAISLFALAALWQHRLLPGAVLLVASAALHPLVGFAAILVGGWIALDNWKHYALLALAGCMAAIALALAGIAPFTWLLERLDPQWHEITRLRDTIVYPSRWYVSMALAAAFFPVTVLIIASLTAEPRLARLSRNLLILSAGLVALSVLGSGLLANRLIASLQIWRVLLFLSLFGNMAFVAALLNGRLSPQNTVLLGAAGLFSALESALGMISFGSAGIALSVLIVFLAETARGRPLPMWPRIVLSLPGIAGCALSLTAIGYKLIAGLPLYELCVLLLRLDVIALAVAALFRPGAFRASRTTIASVLTVCLVVVALIADDRGPEARYIDSPARPDPEVIAALRSKTVYWENGAQILWFKLKMPVFYSCRQKGGIVFFRAQALEFERRAQALRGLNTQDFTPHPVAGCPVKAKPGENGPTHRAQLEAACTALPELDLLVLHNAVPGAPPRMSFALPLPGDDDAGETVFRIYDCSDFRPA